MDSISKFLALTSERRIKVAVVGDCLVDEYYPVTANRVSPEFPIPVMQTNSTEDVVRLPGGAGNVCAQFRHFNVDVDFFSLVDHQTREVLESAGIRTDHCETMWPGKNPIKRRLYNGDFPLCRWDIEAPNFGLDDEDIHSSREKLFKKYQEAQQPDVVIFSDYNKGVFGPDLIGGPDWMRGKNKKPQIIVDPKTGSLSKWIGCDIFKPNAKEADEFAKNWGCKNWKEQADTFQRTLACNNVIITQSGDGVVGKFGPEHFEYRPTHNTTVESVIGAGDCFIAVLAIAHALGMEGFEAVEVAWRASFIYVQRKHNRPVFPHELLAPRESKIVTPEFLAERDFKITFTNGCFDLLHAGHLGVLDHCRSFGNKVVVGINSDESIKKLKGESRPIIPLKRRMEMLAALETVDYVVPFNEETPLELITQIAPECLVKGGDYRVENIVGVDRVKAISVYPYQDGLSTSSIVKKIKET